MNSERLQFFSDYLRHSALNFGQAAQGLRYFFSHPDIDPVAPRGTFEHAARSARLRSTRVINDLFFALIPPQSHHTKEELRVMRDVSVSRWFQYGYCAWRFSGTGEAKGDLSGVDRRWDPRCQAPSEIGAGLGRR